MISCIYYLSQGFTLYLHSIINLFNFFFQNNQGLSSQSYALQLSSDMLFSEVYQCSDEISGFLTNHENWITPILPQHPGCPAIEFNPEQFQEMSQNWICV